MKTINPSTSLRINGERSRTIKFYTLGCKVNQYDTQSIRERFLACGFRELADGKPADFYLINTCTVTHKADRDSRYLIQKARQQNPGARIIVTGCLAEKDSSFLSGLKGIDYVISKRYFGDNITGFSGHTRAFLKIQDGCDNFCAYCKVPGARGRSRSKDLRQIAREAEALVKNGFQEIVLCGICLGAYGRDLLPKRDLVEAIEKMEGIAGLLRIRLSSIEAADISPRLIDKFVRGQKLCRHLHIPMQSGDDAILNRMRRKYLAGDYLRLVRRIRKNIPGIAITTDVLVGFPGEKEAHFSNTLRLVRDVLPLRTHIFAYSPRPGTAAFVMKEKIGQGEIKQRISRLKKLAAEYARAYKRKFLGKDAQVLIEGRAKDRPGYWQGYSGNYLKVILKAEENLENRLVRVRLKKIEEEHVLADFKPGPRSGKDGK